MLFEETKQKLKAAAIAHYIILVIAIIMMLLNTNGIVKSPLLNMVIQPAWIYYVVWIIYSLLIAVSITVFLIKHSK